MDRTGVPMTEDRRTTLREMESEELARIEQYERHMRREGGPLDRDMEEQAIEVENDEVVEGLLEGSRARLAQIRHALERVESGGGDLCEDCDEPIPPGRLEALPTATLCTDCAEVRG